MHNLNPFAEPFVPRNTEQQRVSVHESQRFLFFTFNNGFPHTNPFVEPVVPLFFTFNSGFPQRNPLMEPIEPRSNGQRRTGDDESRRSLFFTFDSGSPLTKEEIYDFFTSRHGPNSVQYVYVHKQEKRIPEFGKIIFSSPNLPRWIMQDFEVVRVCVMGKPLWLKNYVSPSHRHANVNQN